MRGVFLLATCWLMADLLCVSAKFYLVKTKHSRHLKFEENVDDRRSPEDPLPEITLDNSTTNVEESVGILENNSTTSEDSMPEDTQDNNSTTSEDSMSEDTQDNNSTSLEDSMPEDTQDKNSTVPQDSMPEGTQDNNSTTMEDLSPKNMQDSNSTSLEDPLSKGTVDNNSTSLEDPLSEGTVDNNSTSLNNSSTNANATFERNARLLEDNNYEKENGPESGDNEGNVTSASDESAGNDTLVTDAVTEENRESPESEDTPEPGSDYSLGDETGSHADWSPENRIPTITLDGATDDSKKGSGSGDNSDWSPEHDLPSITLD